MPFHFFFHTPRRSHFMLWMFALLLIAVSAISTKAHGQINLKISGQNNAAVVQTPRVRAELVVQAPEGVVAGQSFWLGLKLAHEPHWHTYWKNAGDSGLPTTLQWQLPEGLTAGEIQWPVPQALRVGPLVNYGYENTTLLPLLVQVSPDFKAPASGMVDVHLSANWLICHVECIPESGEFTLQIPVQGSSAAHRDAFFKAQAQQPAPLSRPGEAAVQAITPQSNAPQAGERLTLRVPGLPATLQGQTLEFYPEDIDTFHHAAESGKDWQQHWEGDVWVAENLPLSDMRGETPAALNIVVALPVEQRDAALSKGEAIAWHSTLHTEGRWTAATLTSVSPALAAALEANKANASAPASTTTPAGSWWAALLGGLIGGLILNLMPCVFPVLAIKVMGFAAHGPNQRALRMGGVAYAVGVILSFVALGAVLLGLRAAGQQLGWGFQLQSPMVVSLLAALFTVLGLNLAGLFEFGSVVPSRIASVQARNPVADSFLSGVLAVAIASPCTAPFMGASLGFAIDMPPAQALTVFAALGVGMALPYVLASFVPAIVGWLPRPGAWMQTFRHAMAFPMFATVVWLVWVLGHQSGMDAAAALLALLVVLAALIWALGLQGKSRVILSLIAGLLVAAIAYQALPLLTSPTATESAQATPGERWQPWSAEKVQTLQAQGQPVFVDFTAAWCVTCQVNKRTTLSNPEVLAAFDEHQVQLLRADWTRQDPAITQALQTLGRSGVPVYVLYASGKPPVVLSELLSKGEVLNALGQL